MSVAQFERTMSKVAGRAEKGIWSGGNVPLGFDYSKERQRDSALVRWGGTPWLWRQESNLHVR